MAVFSTNQVRHLYVAKAKKDSAAALTAVGDIAVSKDNEGTHVYFQYMGAGNNLVRSDLIPIKNIAHVKAVDGATMAHKMKKLKVTLADIALNGENPAIGQDYVLRVVINPYVGMSDEEPYMKYGAVHTYKGDTTSTFYAKMAISLANNFSRELEPMLKFSLASDSSEVEVKAGTKIEALNGTYTGIIIEEVGQEWKRGIKQETYVNFEVYPTTIVVDGDEVTWGKVEKMESTVIVNNGRKIADLEYFCMGERGDIYRGINWPDNIDTEYLVTPLGSNGSPTTYHTFEIHYVFTDTGVNSYKSEKDITIVSDNKAELNKVITAFNSATGLSIRTL